ncbi:MAG: 5'-nucleotidase C-terminal domain-containing protein [Dysgonomonas sp.]|nr:5'-nucleotidase C-terminal domain-containing protein [Dysgonomonas sp.]
MKKIFAGIILVAVAMSCSRQQYMVTKIDAQRYSVNQKLVSNSNEKINQLVASYKELLDKEMNQVIGKASEDMTYGRPESLLTNLTSDVMLKYANTVLNQHCDLSFMNVNGHRANLAKGDITVGSIYEIYSFENTLAVVKLKGIDLLEAFDSYAKLGGAGVSSTVKLVVQDGKVKDVRVNGNPIDKDRVYTIITLDYLADGNDGLQALKKAIETEDTGITLRDIMLDYIKQQTAEGKAIVSHLDNRITIEK